MWLVAETVDGLELTFWHGKECRCVLKLGDVPMVRAEALQELLTETKANPTKE